MIRIATSPIALFLLIQLCGCVTDELGRRIHPEDVTWIQKGQTTREQITAKFGQPTFKMARRDDNDLGEYAEYRYERPAVTLLPRTQGPVPQVFRTPSQRLQPYRTIQNIGVRLWVIYDARGIIEDFGFESPPPAQGYTAE